MADDNKTLVVAAGAHPVAFTGRIRLHGAKSINMYTVVDHDLNELEHAGRRENYALAFFCACGGALVSTVLNWTTGSALTAAATGIYVAATIPLSVLTVWFGVTWSLAYRSKRIAIKAIRESAGPSQDLEFHASPPPRHR